MSDITSLLIGEVASTSMFRITKTRDLVVISEGYFLEGSDSSGLDEKDIEERPKVADGAKHEFYNVLWVEWKENSHIERDVDVLQSKYKTL